MPNATLGAIRTKVRQLTRSPSTAHLTDDQIDEFVNTFIAYDIPEHLRLFSLRKVLTFFTEPYIDTYETNAIVGSGLNDFKNLYITVHEPIYIAGRRALYTQSREQFYAFYPIVNNIKVIGSGTGALTNFSGTLTPRPFLRNEVLLSAIDSANNGLAAYDDGNGNLIGDVVGGINTIDYVTGAYNVTFNAAPAASTQVKAQTVPYVAAIPQTILYFENKFIIRPVPDQPYRISMEAYYRPSDLLAASAEPILEQWWQYIAYGSAKKIFENRMEPESVQAILPQFNEQERLVLRRTLVQQSNERTATIYTDTAGFGFGYWPYGPNF